MPTTPLVSLPPGVQSPSASGADRTVLVGVLATSAAVAFARPPSALCGEKSDVLLGGLRTLSWRGAQLQLRVSLRQR